MRNQIFIEKYLCKYELFTHGVNKITFHHHYANLSGLFGGIDMPESKSQGSSESPALSLVIYIQTWFYVLSYKYFYHIWTQMGLIVV